MQCCRRVSRRHTSAALLLMSVWRDLTPRRHLCRCPCWLTPLRRHLFSDYIRQGLSARLLVSSPSGAFPSSASRPLRVPMAFSVCLLTIARVPLSSLCLFYLVFASVHDVNDHPLLSYVGVSGFEPLSMTLGYKVRYSPSAIFPSAAATATPFLFVFTSFVLCVAIL